MAAAINRELLVTRECTIHKKHILLLSKTYSTINENVLNIVGRKSGGGGGSGSGRTFHEGGKVNGSSVQNYLLNSL